MQSIKSLDEFKQLAESVIYGFELDKENVEVFTLLYQYLTRDKAFEENGFSLNKGILLMGNYGTGKTGFLKALQRAFKSNGQALMFKSAHSPSVAEDFSNRGYEAFLKFKSDHWSIDEIGAKEREQVQHFGNKVNVSEALILHRYQYFTDRSLLTHFTTNLSDSEMKLYFDGKTYSRLREMCNFLVLVGKDRRLTAKVKPVEVEEIKEVKPSTEEIKKIEAEFVDRIHEAFEIYLKEGEYKHCEPPDKVYDYLSGKGFLKLTNDLKKKVFNSMAVTEKVADRKKALGDKSGLQGILNKTKSAKALMVIEAKRKIIELLFAKLKTHKMSLRDYMKLNGPEEFIELETPQPDDTKEIKVFNQPT